MRTGITSFSKGLLVGVVILLLLTAFFASVYLGSQAELSKLQSEVSDSQSQASQLQNQVSSLHSQVQSLLALIASMSNSTQPSNSTQTNGSTASSTTITGLKMTMILNSTRIISGQAVSVSLSETNTLSQFNNITGATDWSYNGFQEQLCSPGIGFQNLPFSIAIVPGYYTEANVSGTTSLPLYWSKCWVLPACVSLGGPPNRYDFYPLSSTALVHNGTGFASANESVSTTISFVGSYDQACLGIQVQGPPPSFPTGTYTVIGGDEWGQLVLLYFTVS
jgi:hypothetical protein